MTNLDDFLASMRQGGKFVNARLQAALALLERLREYPSLKLSDHKKSNSSGIISHETFGEKAHERWEIKPLNKNHGRRSNDIGGWGQPLLDEIAKAGFASATTEARTQMIDEVQGRVASVLRNILDQDPIEVRVKGRTAEAVIRDVMKQAEEKGKSGDVAQYLVGAKLELRLGDKIPVIQANKGDRKSYTDLEARTGDYEIKDATIEIAVGTPDDKHLTQVANVLEETDREIWILTRHDRVASWTTELRGFEGVNMNRVVVSSVDSFVGQNVSEMGSFSMTGKANSLQELFKLYNEKWIDAVGTPGIRIVVK